MCHTQELTSIFSQLFFSMDAQLDVCSMEQKVLVYFAVFEKMHILSIYVYNPYISACLSDLPPLPFVTLRCGFFCYNVYVVLRSCGLCGRMHAVQKLLRQATSLSILCCRHCIASSIQSWLSPDTRESLEQLIPILVSCYSNLSGER